MKAWSVAIFHTVRQFPCALQWKTSLLAFYLLLPICTEAGNAKIAAIVQTFEGTSLYSGSSFWPAIALPKDASPSLICEALLKSGFDQFTSYRITTTETVRMVLDHVPVGTDGKPKWTPIKEPITATLIQTDDGDKVVFMDFKEAGWRTAVYNIPTETVHTPVWMGGLTNAFSACTNTDCMSGANKESKTMGCQDCGDPFRLPQKSDQDLIKSFGFITNGMSKLTLLRTLGRPADAEGDSMHWIVYSPGRALHVTFRGSVVTNVGRRSWVDDPPHED